MKKILFLFFACAIIAGASAQKPEVIAPKLAGQPLMVDGVLDEAVWANVPQTAIEQPFKGEGFSGADDCSAFFQTVWSDQGLYIAVTVTDDVNYTSGAPYGPVWNSDMIEIYLDMNVGNLNDAVGAGAGKGHYQNAGNAVNSMGTWKTFSSFAYKMNGASYVKEAFLSWADLKTVDGAVITPGADVEIGFDICVVDNDKDSTDSALGFRNRLLWSNIGTVNENWNNMDEAGILKFDTETVIENAFEVTASKISGMGLTIDGMLSEDVWAGVEKVAIAQPFKGEAFTGGVKDCAGYFQTVWSDQGVYIAVTVTDDKNQTDNSAGPAWNQDMVEIYFDMNVGNLKDGLGTEEKKGHYQVAGNAVNSVNNWGKNSKYAYKMNGASYIKEAFVSWSDLKDVDGNIVTPSSDIEIGLDIYIVDNDADTLSKDRGYRDRLVWANAGAVTETWNNADDGGILKFDTENVFERPFEVMAPKLTGLPLTIDGSLSEAVWADVPKLTIQQTFKGEAILGGNDDCSGYFQTIWNEQGVYIAVTVTDDVNQTDNSAGPAWNQDMVEIYFDMNVGNLKDGLGTEEKKGHYQVAGNAVDGVNNWGTSSKVAYKMNGASYVKEVFVSWSDLKDVDGNIVTPSSEIEIGLDVYVVDNDADTLSKGRGYRDRLVWANAGAVTETWNNADDGGILKFDDATVIDNPAVVDVAMVTGDPIVADGKLEETVWADAEKITIGQVFKGEQIAGGAADCSGYFQTVWDADGIYIAVTVTDDVNQIDNSAGPSWNQDMVEIYLDMNIGNLKDGLGKEENKGHYQVAGNATDGIVNWGTESKFAYVMDGASYIKEVFVSWADLKDSAGVVLTPEAGIGIGFDVYVVDNDADTVDSGRGYRNRLVWANAGAVTETWNNADDAGIITLTDTEIANVYVVEPDYVENFTSEATVYPNPAKEVLYVKNVSSNAVVRVLSLDGKLMTQSVGNSAININMLQNGLYLVQISDQNRITTKRIVVQ